MMGTGGGKAQTLVTADGAGATVGFLREELGRVGGRAVERYVAVSLLPHEPEPLPQDQALARLADTDGQQQEELRAALLRVLSGSALEAYFFEARPIISPSSLAPPPPFEFVLVDAPELLTFANTYHG